MTAFSSTYPLSGNELLVSLLKILSILIDMDPGGDASLLPGGYSLQTLRQIGAFFVANPHLAGEFGGTLGCCPSR